ncbi:MAG: DNA primase [SAR86 cluster bacterium SAR86A]|uniref:DNA primase n=1 Tax=SAR86 cluster bacterium SAR86A TaxID=1123866 RepID=J5KAJ9_9GAMM|nr:MAG: DNA primase [SAR86 cluster bacterium SAR86A]
MSIPSTFIDRLLSSINIVDVIGRRLTLERKGGAYWAKCPFHGSGEERTASFKVYEETGTYHCFGCKESGNAIHFLRKHDGLDFLEAVETLATQVGMEIPKQEAPVDTSNATKINNRASQVFYEQLKSDQGKKTIKYLKERGISGETAKFFQLGYSSNKKPTLYENLKNEFKEIDLDESGLFGKNDDGEYYDRFRDRLMFPIRNIKGECIAFGGRLLSDKKDQAKYLNSPETKTYKKKYELYGLYEIREINKRPESIFLVEGYMDVIGLFQHGIKNAVASSGTAFTQEQLRKILSYTNTIYIVFDGDEAGYKASWRAVENALPLLREDTRISFIFLEPDEDPDSYVSSNGKDAFLNLAKEAKSFSDFFFDYVKDQDDLTTLEGRSMVAKFALPLVNKISNDTLKEAYINEVSKICDLDFSKLIQGESKSKKVSPTKKEEVKESTNTVLRKSVLGIFTALIQHPKLSSINEFSLITHDSKFNFINDIKNLYQDSPDSNPSIIFEKIESERIKNIFGEALVSEVKLSEEDATSMIKDCLKIISQTNSEREEILKEKYNMQELTSAEKRELQQIILKKDKMSQDEEALIKNLSSI